MTRLLLIAPNLFPIFNQQADMSEEESAVDEMVASRELYGLSEEEFRIMEGKNDPE